MTKYPTSDKVSFGIKSHIKKGYYPGKLLKVELFADNNGKAKVGKYGQQLIFEFAVYKKDQETDAPIEPMKYCTNKELKTEADVIISKFVYHMYKAAKKGEQWVEGEFQTAITPNSAITKILKALGWTFSTEDVDPEDFVGNWVELDIDDYTQGEGDEAYTASTIKDINPYEGPEVKDIEDVKATEKPKNVAKQVKHEAVKEEKSPEDREAKCAQITLKIQELEKMNKEGFLTDDGLKQSKEQLETQIEALKQ
ncbi:hypothetical protein LCGC14_2600580 [marine sediment metagenome]|uniref:Uncharacterized protein n=1 Tax=marine sediment metagenome TaxID=412755 RepID=A0A0F9A930_9ZZZZ